MQLNDRGSRNVRLAANQAQEVIMSALGTLPQAERPPGDASGLFVAQRVILGEMVTASDEMLEDVRAEMHLAAEFAHKINEAHSVENIRTVLRECGQHQMDVFSREGQNFL